MDWMDDLKNQVSVYLDSLSMVARDVVIWGTGFAAVLLVLVVFMPLMKGRGPRDTYDESHDDEEEENLTELMDTTPWVPDGPWGPRPRGVG